MTFLGEILLSLGVDKRRYEVGEAPKYIVQAGIPGSRVLWTSFKNGIATGEFNADYGQVVGANGTAELIGGPWTDADAGQNGSQWEKQALVIAPDGSQQLVQTFFSVSPKAAGAATPTVPSSAVGSFWENPLFSIGGFDITPPIAIAAAIGGYFLTKKR